MAMRLSIAPDEENAQQSLHCEKHFNNVEERVIKEKYCYIFGISMIFFFLILLNPVIIKPKINKFFVMDEKNNNYTSLPLSK